MLLNWKEKSVQLGWMSLKLLVVYIKSATIYINASKFSSEENYTVTMEACFLSSNSFTKTAKVIPFVRASARVPDYCTRKKFGLYHSKKVVPFSVACCQSGSKSSWPEDDEERSLVNFDWRSFRARLVAGERLSSSPEETYSLVVDPDTVVDQPPALVTIGDKWVHKIHEPEKGCLLIATEKLDGVHIFERTVILLLSTGPIGPTGIILNRPSLMSIKEMKSSKLDAVGTFYDRPLFFGGPLKEGFFLLSPEDDTDDGGGVGNIGVFEEIMKGLYYGSKGSVGCVAEMVKRKMVGVGDLRFFDGYCAWEKQQLRKEIRSGYWTLAACSPSVIELASVGSIGLWDEIIGLMDPRKVW